MFKFIDVYFKDYLILRILELIRYLLDEYLIN